jgi:hypothetical protein
LSSGISAGIASELIISDSIIKNSISNSGSAVEIFTNSSSTITNTQID